MKEKNKQIKNKKRVLEHGEVLTSKREVLDMLNLVNNETDRLESKFLEPACGDGNFLSEILNFKLKILEKNFKKNKYKFEKNSVLTFASIYGIDILKDNVIIARKRLLKQFIEVYKKIFNSETNSKLLIHIKYILEKNIVHADALSFLLINKKETEKIFNIKFDVIIGNPPYQMKDGGEGASAKPIYQKFIQVAKKLKPNYLVMIIPSRWFSGGKGLSSFRKEMLNDKRISKIFDFPNSSDCFPGVKIEGGVCYFLWDKNYLGDCEVTNIEKNSKNLFKRPLLEKNLNFFVRYNQSVSIIKKVLNFNQGKFDKIVSPRKPYGLSTNFKGKSSKSNNSIKIYQNGGTAYIKEKEIKINNDLINKYKVYLTKAYGLGASMPYKVLNTPIYGEPNSVCTETYVQIGPFSSKKICENAMSYIKTKFFRFLVLMIKNTQDATRAVYRLVPIQSFENKWDDKSLFKKYGLTQSETKFIDEMIRPMD